MEKFSNKTIIIAGCGGGYDLFGGLIFYHRLKTIAKKIILVNYSFTPVKLLEETSQKINDHLYVVTPDIKLPSSVPYYPEAYLSIELNQCVYALSNDPTVKDIIDSYNSLINIEGTPDVIYLVDGGCDVLLTGNEIGLGTPVEDMMHLKALISIDIKYKYILAIGVNVDTAHGVVQDDINNRLNTLESSHVMMSKEYLMLSNPSVKFYYDVVKKCHPVNTIVHSLVISALEGHRGLYTPAHLKLRIKKSKVPLLDQTCTLYQFDFNKIANEVKYLGLIKSDLTSDEVDTIIENYHC